MDFLDNANGTEIVFWLTAILGTVFFFLRVVMMIVGGFGDDAGVDASHADATSIETDHTGADGHDSEDGSDASFKLVSLNSITGFIMMFGWAGLAAFLQFHLNDIISFLIAFVVGLLCMFITASLFKMASKLTSPGARFNINDTIGTAAEVYLRIPENGTGKIKITVNSESRIVSAVSEDKNEIDSFKRVTVVNVVNADTISVKEI